MSTRIAIRINARLEELVKVEGIIEDLHADGKLPDESFGNAMVIATEATLNAIHHGSSNDPDKLIDVIIELEGTQIIVEVSDSGKGFDFNNLPDPTDPANIEKGSGRGIFIMKNLSDELEFLNDGATIRATIDLKVPVTVGV